MAEEYALYKGEEFIEIGTIQELAELLNVKPSTVNFYRYAAYQKRAKNNKNRIIVTPLDEPKIYEMRARLIKELSVQKKEIVE